MNRTTTVLLGISRILVGLLFVVSGLIKVNDLTGFIYKLEEYLQVFESDFGLKLAEYLPLVPIIAKSIAVTEAVIGFALLLGIIRLPITLLLILVMIFFTLLTGYSAVSGKVQDCGCFGEVLHISPWVSFGKDVVLLFLAFFMFVYREDIHPLFPRKAINYVLGLLLAGLTYVLMAWCYEHLPIVDFSAYAVGQNIETNMTTRNAEGQPLAKDYTSFAASCDSAASEFKGAVLLILSYDLTKADSNAIAKAIDLGNELNGTDIQAILGTSSTSAVRDSIKAAYKPNFCVATADLTVIKTMIRSNPGYMLLKDGTVVGKWAAVDAPTKEALQAKLK